MLWETRVEFNSPHWGRFPVSLPRIVAGVPVPPASVLIWVSTTGAPSSTVRIVQGTDKASFSIVLGIGYTQPSFIRATFPASNSSRTSSTYVAATPEVMLQSDSHPCRLKVLKRNSSETFSRRGCCSMSQRLARMDRGPGTKKLFGCLLGGGRQ